MSNYNIENECNKLPSEIKDGISWENRELLIKWMKENEVTEIKGSRSNTQVYITGWGHCKGIRVGAAVISFTCTKQLEDDYEMEYLVDKIEGLKKFIKEKAEADKKELLGPLYKGGIGGGDKE